VWSIRNDDEIQIWREIEATSDRVTAIVSAAFIEERVRDAISSRLLRDSKRVKKLFDPDGPIGTYDAKVLLGYLIGIYVDETRKNLEAIGKMRNRFAHRPRIAKFDDRDLDPFFKEITLPERLLGDPSTDHYHLVGTLTPLKPDAPKRQRFLTTIQMLLAYLLPHIYQEGIPPHYQPPF
jgi:hypothetical protein